MKKLFYLFISLIFISCSEYDNLQNNILFTYTAEDVPPLTEDQLVKYYNDAIYIEYSRIIEDSVLKEKQIFLDQENIGKHYEDLILLHQKSYLLGNTFFENFMRIHNYHAQILHTIIAKVDSSKEWIQNIINGSNFTGKESIDSLIINYDLEFKFDSQFYNYYMIIIRSKIPYNTYALSNKLFSTGEFEYVEPDLLIGDGSSIKFKTENNLRIYIYRFGWGDCTAGCINSHYWLAGITENRDVILISEYGDPLPVK